MSGVVLGPARQEPVPVGLGRARQVPGLVHRDEAVRHQPVPGPRPRRRDALVREVVERHRRYSEIWCLRPGRCRSALDAFQPQHTLFQLLDAPLVDRCKELPVEIVDELQRDVVEVALRVQERADVPAQRRA